MSAPGGREGLAAWRPVPGLRVWPTEDGCVVYEPAGGDTHLVSDDGARLLTWLMRPAAGSDPALPPDELAAALSQLAQAGLIRPSAPCASKV